MTDMIRWGLHIVVHTGMFFIRHVKPICYVPHTYFHQTIERRQSLWHLLQITGGPQY